MVLTADLRQTVQVPVELVKGALHIMDDKGRGIPGNSHALWDKDWDALRAALFAMLPDDRQTHGGNATNFNT